MIFNNELRPGEKLLQEKLAAQLGVSRTPLMKALRMLEYDLLVESIPRRGMFVKKMSVQEMIDIYDVREGIESVAVRLLIERATPEQIGELELIWEPFGDQDPIDPGSYQKADDLFHARLLDYSGNRILSTTYSNSLLQARVEQLGIMRSPEETLPEHQALVKAITERDAEKADMEIRNHLRKSKETIKDKFNIEKQEGYERV